MNSFTNSQRNMKAYFFPVNDIIQSEDNVRYRLQSSSGCNNQKPYALNKSRKNLASYEAEASEIVWPGRFNLYDFLEEHFRVYFFNATVAFHRDEASCADCILA